MRILVSNDDGIDAPGMRVLEDAVAKFGEVVVVAPDRERSGAGHSLTLHRPLRIHAKNGNRYSVDGTPTDCVNLAVKAISKGKPFDLMVSGINAGPNLGDDITYSGTVSAALESTMLGIPAIAFSLATIGGDLPNFENCISWVQKIVQKVLSYGLPSDVLLNVNFPNQKQNLESLVFTRQGKRHFSDAFEEKIDPRGRKYYWIGGEEMGFDDIPGTDCHAIRHGMISLTPIRLNLTHELFLDEIKEWKL